MLRFQREPQPGIEQSKPFARDRHRQLNPQSTDSLLQGRGPAGDLTGTIGRSLWGYGTEPLFTKAPEHTRVSSIGIQLDI